MKSIRQLCIAILIVTAISAIAGGYMLINDDSGRALQLDLNYLKGSFIKDYSLPGWILVIMIGAFSLVAAVVSFLHKKSYPYFIMLAGAFLFFYIIAEIYFIQQFQFLQIIFSLFALALVLLGNLIRKNLKLVPDHSEQNTSVKHPHKKSHYHKHRKRGH